MNWKPHFIIGIVLFFLLGYFVFHYDQVNLVILSLIAGFAALIPDLDHDLGKFRQWLNKLVPICSFVLFFFYFRDWYSALITALIITGAYFVLFVFLKPKHRGITHTLVALVLLSIIVYFYDINLAYAFFIGYFSHLLADKCIKVI